MQDLTLELIELFPSKESYFFTSVPLPPNRAKELVAATKLDRQERVRMGI